MIIDDSIWKISRDENSAETKLHRARRSEDITADTLFKRNKNSGVFPKGEKPKIGGKL